MDQDEYQQHISAWGEREFDALYYRLTGGYELIVFNGRPIGEQHEGMWTVHAFHYGQPLHTINHLIRLSPSTHLDAARSAVVTLKCAGLIGADAVEA
ncbi:hypothetical protein KDK95_21995 [Actinospica sp. MGRD01-02]|uniref:Uncharacterized protein n=1 Tax=Actinospica acidithermotolerans TaxID=2828514 RepID=A0A941ECL8_9ACTN|nr:hypothetical protein [Actinospica acidithermotolerans]MBR7828996.1 hypothetical protein [Actinospica acidithermotolerans]